LVIVAVKPLAVGVTRPIVGTKAELSEVAVTMCEPVSEPALEEVIVKVEEAPGSTPVTVMSAPLITTDPALAEALQVKVEL
jgi:hypothetical protein